MITPFWNRWEPPTLFEEKKSKTNISFFWKGNFGFGETPPPPFRSFSEKKQLFFLMPPLIASSKTKTKWYLHQINNKCVNVCITTGKCVNVCITTAALASQISPHRNVYVKCIIKCKIGDCDHQKILLFLENIRNLCCNRCNCKQRKKRHQRWM